MSSAAPADERWLCLPALPESAGRSRAFVRSSFEQWDLDDGLDEALLLVSELCSNVVRHARTPMVLGVVWQPLAHLVRVSVRDESALMPEVQRPDLLAQSGRGLLIVRRVAWHWGVERFATGKAVWFEVRVHARPALTATRSAQRDGS